MGKLVAAACPQAVARFRRPPKSAHRRRRLLPQHRQMGNLLNFRARHARSQMRNGIKLYQQQNPQQAVRQWQAALRKLKSAEDKFLTSGYIAQAFCDSGDFDQMLNAAVQQVELANSQRDDFMKSEALLNLARANERLAQFEKAIGFAEESLSLPGIDNRSPGYAHLVIANAQMGLSNLQQSLHQFEKAMKISIETGDKLLELQISLGLGNLFTIMKDLNKALVFLQNALAILHGIEANHVHAKYKSAILHLLSVILRLKGRFAEAREVCEESIELAKRVGNKPIFARSLASLADICRELGETEARETVTKSWARYVQAFRLLRKTNDRMGQILVLASMAKSASENKGVHYAGRCECQAIQLNRKCLELAGLVGCKHAMMECHWRLQELYSQLADEENAEIATRAHCQLVQQMELFCNFCGQRFGEAEESLQALNCSHIFHEKCLQKFFARLGDGACTCPKCRAKTGIMESISLSSSNAQTPASESIADFFSSVPSTSAAPQKPPVVLCERNFDNSRWASPAIVQAETAERQICLSTSTNATFTASIRREPQPPMMSSFAAKKAICSFVHQKENARPPLPGAGGRGEEEGDELQTIDLLDEHSAAAQNNQMLLTQNHVEAAGISRIAAATTNASSSSSSSSSSRNGGGGASSRSKRLLALGKMAISPVVEEADEEEQDNAMISMGGRGVTEL